MTCCKNEKKNICCPIIRNHIVFYSILDTDALVHYIIDSLKLRTFPVISYDQREGFVAVEIISGSRKYILEIHPSGANERGRHFQVKCRRTLGKLSLLCGKSEDAELHRLVDAVANIVYNGSGFSEIHLGCDVSLPSFLDSPYIPALLKLPFSSSRDAGEGIRVSAFRGFANVIGHMINDKKTVSGLRFGSEEEACQLFNTYDKFLLWSRILFVFGFILLGVLISLSYSGSSDTEDSSQIWVVISKCFFYFTFLLVLLL